MRVHRSHLGVVGGRPLHLWAGYGSEWGAPVVGLRECAAARAAWWRRRKDELRGTRARRGQGARGLGVGVRTLRRCRPGRLGSGRRQDRAPHRRPHPRAHQWRRRRRWRSLVPVGGLEPRQAQCGDRPQAPRRQGDRPQGRRRGRRVPHQLPSPDASQVRDRHRRPPGREPLHRLRVWDRAGCARRRGGAGGVRRHQLLGPRRRRDARDTARGGAADRPARRCVR